MNYFTSWTVFLALAAQVCFLVVVIAVTGIAGFDDVQTGHFGQSFCTLCLLVFFSWGWKILPSRPPTQKVPEGHKLLLEGFRQNWRSLKKIHRHYKSFQWFLIASALAEAGVSSLLPIAVTFLQGELNFSGTQVGIVFLISLLCSLPGTYGAAKVTEYLNPNSSLKLGLLVFAVVTAGGSFALTADRPYLGYVWGVLWGASLGWFYSSENLCFSLCIPSGHEAEFSGLFIYSNQILLWLPPLLFSILVETGVEQRYGLLSLVTFQVLAIAVLSLLKPWEEVLKEARQDVEKTGIEASPGEEILGGLPKRESTDQQHLETLSEEEKEPSVEDSA